MKVNAHLGQDKITEPANAINVVSMNVTCCEIRIV